MSTGKNFRVFTISLTALIVFFGQPSFAAHDKEARLGILYGVADYSDDLVSDLDPTAVVFRFVPVTDKWFGFEGRLGLGAAEGSDTVNSFPGGAEIEVDVHSVLGLFLNAHSNIGQLASIYGLVGFGWVRYDLRVNDTLEKAAEDESGMAYGLGMNFGKQGGIQWNLEYMQYLDKSDFDLGAISVGVLF